MVTRAARDGGGWMRRMTRRRVGTEEGGAAGTRDAGGEDASRAFAFARAGSRGNARAARASASSAERRA